MKPYQQIIRHHMPDAPKAETPKVEMPPVITPKEDPKRPIVTSGNVHLFRTTTYSTYACGIASSYGNGHGTYKDAEVTCMGCRATMAAYQIENARKVNAENFAAMLNAMDRDKTPPMGIKLSDLTVSTYSDPVTVGRKVAPIHGHLKDNQNRTKYACGKPVDASTVMTYSYMGITCPDCKVILAPKDPMVTHGLPSTFNTEDLRYFCGKEMKGSNQGGTVFYSRVTCEDCRKGMEKYDSFVHWYSTATSNQQAACGRLTFGKEMTWKIDKITCPDCKGKVRNYPMRADV